eukprot:gene30411-34481_t
MDLGGALLVVDDEDDGGVMIGTTGGTSPAVEVVVVRRRLRWNKTPTYIGPTVRVSGTYKSGKGMFKDKVRLVQTLDIMHDGPVWVMKFAPNGHYLATGGQDAKVIIWCVAEIPKAEHGGSNHHSSTHASSSQTGAGANTSTAGGAHAPSSYHYSTD